MNTAQIAEQIIRRHQGEVLTLVHRNGELLSGQIELEGDFAKVDGVYFYLKTIREVFPGPLTRQQIQEFYREHGVPQEARYA